MRNHLFRILFYYYHITWYKYPNKIINNAVTPKKIPTKHHVITFLNNVASGSESPTTAIIKAKAVDIKSVMQSYSETDRQKAVDAWLCDYAESRQPFGEIKHRHTLNEADDVAEGKYDWKIERMQENGIKM